MIIIKGVAMNSSLEIIIKNNPQLVVNMRTVAKMMILLVFACFVVGCSSINPLLQNSSENTISLEYSVPPSSASVSEKPMNESLLEPSVSEGYYQKYIKPLTLSQALDNEWDSPEQLLDTPVQMVGYLAQGFLSAEQWTAVFECGYSKEEGVVYIPQDIAELIIYNYFGLSSDTVRQLSPQYDYGRKSYKYYGAKDSGLEDVEIVRIQVSGNIVTIECEFFSARKNAISKCQLIIQLSNEDEFKYISNQYI